MRRLLPFPLATLLLLGLAAAAFAGVATSHRISFQGLARNLANQPVATGDVRVRIYDAASAGALVYDSGSEFNGAISAGAFSVLLGGGTPLLLDATRQYFLELDVNGQEVVGDANGGRQAFWPAGGDASRIDLENRISALESAVFATCAAGTFDLDHNPSNGCEFTLDSDGIYVDPNDPAANDGATCGLGPSNTCGGTCIPCLTIAQGLARANTTGRSKVYVADATYNEAVTVVNGKSLLGGYTSGTWARHLGSTSTILRGSSAAGSHLRTVFASGIALATTVEGFVIYGPNNGSAGGNSYGVYVTNSAGLTLKNNVILAGNGGPGVDGGTGPGGTDGVAGSAGANAVQSPTSSCNSSMDRSGGAGGALTCSGTAVNGGAGGGNRCTPISGSEFSGVDGIAAAGTGGGTGGDAGDDGQISSSGTICTPPANPTTGAAGGNGAAGTNGAGGSGGSLVSGSVVSGHWLGAAGGGGFNGNFGRGGGGGGAGGGADGISPSLDVFGGAGGGGGSGACGGTGGGAGNAGGGSFGIFVTGGGAPTITSNVIVRGTGGAGGRGGIGGRGGFGGLGANGGSALFFCVGAGGRGGDGGAGGAGGGGGGGGGGMSCGIYTSGIGNPGYAASNPAISGGAPGAGGAAGLSFGNAGTAGTTGVVLGVSSN